MSNPERPYPPHLKEIEEAENFTELMQSWDMFTWHQEILFTTLRAAVAGNAGESLDDAIAIVDEAKDNYMEALRYITKIVFDEIEHEEAIDVWSNMMYISLKERLATIRSINIRAAYDLTPVAEVRIGAQKIAEGRLKARRDNVIDKLDAGDEIIVNEPVKEKSYQTHEGIGAEHIHEITQDEIDWDDPSQYSEGDEYNQWVLDAIEEELEDHINELLELCPPDLYE